MSVSASLPAAAALRPHVVSRANDMLHCCAVQSDVSLVNAECDPHPRNRIHCCALAAAQLPLSSVRKPEFWPDYHPSISSPSPPVPTEGVDYPTNSLVGMGKAREGTERSSTALVRFMQPCDVGLGVTWQGIVAWARQQHATTERVDCGACEMPEPRPDVDFNT